MKKTYETPVSEVVTFDNSDVITTSATCKDVWVNTGIFSCTDDNAHWETLN